jgi:hypothetical protein
MASGLLMVAALGFQFGFPIIGFAVGGFMVIAAFINVSTGFCIPSFIYGLIFGKVTCEIKPKPAAN